MTRVLCNTTAFLRILLKNNANRQKLPVKGEASNCNLPIDQAAVRFQTLDPAGGCPGFGYGFPSDSRGFHP